MAKSKRPRGRFIALEGIDGAGTTTQMRLAHDWLVGRGAQCHATAEPTNGPIGALLRQILRGRLVAVPRDGATQPVDPAATALLFAADRLDHLQNEVIPRLEDGWHVICDRYVASSFAYQSLDTDLRFVRQINEKAIAPDLVIYVRVRPEVGMARIATRAGRDAFEQLSVQKRVAAAYDKVFEDWRSSRLVIVDGEQDVSQVTGKVRAAIDSLL